MEINKHDYVLIKQCQHNQAMGHGEPTVCQLSVVHTNRLDSRGQLTFNLITTEVTFLKNDLNTM